MRKSSIHRRLTALEKQLESELHAHRRPPQHEEYRRYILAHSMETFQLRDAYARQGLELPPRLSLPEWMAKNYPGMPLFKYPDLSPKEQKYEDWKKESMEPFRAALAKLRR